MDVRPAPLIIGRQAAQRVLAEAYQSPTASLVSVVGRRRIGKTFLVKQVYAQRIRFSITGIAQASKAEQLANFSLQMERSFGDREGGYRYGDWLEALGDLARLLDAEPSPQRQVLFFDELPWLASRRSGFLRAFSWFWNSYAVDRDVVVVICGSAASWMIKKVVRDRGGLHNRITHRIRLEPFTLGETFAFCDARGLIDDEYQRIQLYMTLGGVPFYLDQLRPGESAQQSIDRLLFAPSAPLAGEFDRLYASLFENPGHHVAVVRALARKQIGLTRGEVARAAGIESSGTLTRVLEELELSGFVLRTVPFGKRRKDSLFRLVDEYSRFYLDFLDGRRSGGDDFGHLATQPSYRAWAGYAFETLALRHAGQIKRALGISGIHATASSYVARANEAADGVQVDLLLDRSDRTVTLIEAKFSEGPFVLAKAYAQQLREKKLRFRAHTGTKKAVTLVLLTTYGVRSLAAGTGIVDGVLEVRALV